MVAVLVCNNTDSRFDFLFAGDAVLLHSPQDILHIGVVQRLARSRPAHGLYNVNALAQQVQPDGIGQHMIILQNRDAVLDRPMDLSVGVLGQDFFLIGKGLGSAFFVGLFVE